LQLAEQEAKRQQQDKERERAKKEREEKVQPEHPNHGLHKSAALHLTLICQMSSRDARDMSAKHDM
jgi:hypothetical protein